MYLPRYSSNGQGSGFPLSVGHPIATTPDVSANANIPHKFFCLPFFPGNSKKRPPRTRPLPDSRPRRQVDTAETPELFHAAGGGTGPGIRSLAVIRSNLFRRKAVILYV
jgi:hypothetical protein